MVNVKKSNGYGKRGVKKLVEPVKLKTYRLGETHGSLSRREIYGSL
jgi:hypothetical protein